MPLPQMVIQTNPCGIKSTNNFTANEAVRTLLPALPHDLDDNSLENRKSWSRYFFSCIFFWIKSDGRRPHESQSYNEASSFIPWSHRIQKGFLPVWTKPQGRHSNPDQLSHPSSPARKERKLNSLSRDTSRNAIPPCHHLFSFHTSSRVVVFTVIHFSWHDKVKGMSLCVIIYVFQTTTDPYPVALDRELLLLHQ